jgi:hypothetical protein
MRPKLTTVRTGGGGASDGGGLGLQHEGGDREGITVVLAAGEQLGQMIKSPPNNNKNKN